MTHAASTFETIEPNLGELLANIRVGKIQLPDFQRGWVWDDNRIRSLIASVSMSYPIGAIMTMETGDNYRFLPRTFEGVSLSQNVNPDILVLDGQQRLTSLYLAFLSGKPVPTTTEKKKEINRYYYLDMGKCLDPYSDRFDAVVSIPENRQITSDFGRKTELDLATRELEYKNGMFPLLLIYDLQGFAQWKQGYIQYFNNASEKFQFLSNFELEVWLRFQQYKVPVIKLNRDTPKDAVCQVFENVNTGGVSLTVFELMTATYAADGYNLREDWEIQKKSLQEYHALRGIDESMFLTAITLLTSYQRHVKDKTAVSCKRKDVLELSLDDYKKNADIIVDGMKSAAKILAREKIFEERNVPYQTQLVPLSAICANLGKRVENDSIKEKIIRWYWCGVFGELYGGANETRYALDMVGVINWLDGGDVPATIRDSNFSPTRLLTLQTRLSAAYKGLMALLMKKGSKDFISGDPIELNTYFDSVIDIHHIFPAAYCEKQNFKREMWNSIINKAALSGRTNRILGGHKPSTYIQTIQRQLDVDPEKLDRIFESHLIDPYLIRSDDFFNFIQDRAKLLLNTIEDATGKAIAGRDSEEVVKAFGGTL
ncbi:MAG TPA: DUF262 domain-containing protein [Alphaproteobacteria bacterium]|nr:DUF262 domain-containing protein [Alphaproteobacteria bacterium]